MIRLNVMLSIIERGNAKQYIKILNSHQVNIHTQIAGHGTAPSEMKDIFGLINNEKDVIISLGTEQALISFAESESRVMSGKAGFGGLAMITKLSAINRVAAELIVRNSSESEKGANKMENENKYSLVLISVNHGYSEEIMQVAKKAGATGGTVIRGRLAGLDILEQVDDVLVDEEREIISVLAPVSISGEIMNNVNAEFGLNSKAKGIIFSIPVTKAFKV